jgi:hypothetical protein
VLIEMGAISLSDEDEFVAHKIEETICGLFDWSEAVFRFYTDELPDPNILRVDLEMRQILERGVKRREERKRSRETIGDPGIVLQRTGRPEPPELAGLPAAKRVFALIDGRKTVAEILLHSHAPEFLVTRFLTALLHGQVVEIVDTSDERPVQQLDPAVAETLGPEAPAHPEAGPPPEPLPSTAWEPAPSAAPALPDDSATECLAAVPEPPVLPAVAGQEPSEARAAPAEFDASDLPPIELPEETPAGLAPEIDSPASQVTSVESPLGALQWEPESPLTSTASDAEPEVSPDPRPSAPPPPSVTDNSRELQREINVALQLMDSGQPEAALELLNAMSAAHPGDTALSKLIGNAEEDYRDQMLAGELGASRIPTLTQVFDSGTDGKPTAEEAFLMEQIDGATDIQSLLWVTPMRDVEVLKTLSSLLRKGWIEVRQAA